MEVISDLSSKKNIVSIVFDLVKPVADEMNFEIWDVKFEKVGPDWFLKIFIDKKSGKIDINDCENFSRKIDPIIDESDPIAQSYFLEVSSPGVERELVTNEHLNRYLGSDVNVVFIRPFNNLKNITARLVNVENDVITVELKNGETVSFDRKQAAKINLSFDEFNDND